MEEGMTLYLHLYVMPAGRGPNDGFGFSYQLYSDAGDGFGPWRLDVFEIAQLDNQVSIQWNSRGDYPFPYNRVVVELHGADLMSAAVDNQAVPIDNRRLDTITFKQAVLQMIAPSTSF